MFYYASKIVWFFLTPSNALVAGVALGVLLGWTRFRRTGKVLAGLSFVMLLFFGLGPGGNLLIIPLERHFPVPGGGLPDAPYGIIILGGGVDDRISSTLRYPLELNEAGDRITALVALARRYPDAKLVYTGGTGLFLGAAETSEADAVRTRIAALGVDPTRMVFETKSLNTTENAYFTAAMVNPRPDQVWWIVTSAYHMPRSIGCFRRAGFTVKSHSVDFRTVGWADAVAVNPTMAEGLRRTDVAFKEWLGLVAYYATGKTDALFPGP